MRFLTIASNYTGPCIQDNFEGPISIDQLGLSDSFIQEINVWNEAYKVIIPLSEKINEIELLDQHGLEIANKLQRLVPGGAKVNYFSEGKLKYLPID